MRDKTLLDQLKQMKEHYAQEGFLIRSLFGSVARDETHEKSDLDLLYETDERFFEKHRGFGAYARLEEIAHEIQKATHKEVDLVSRRHLGIIGKKYILSEAIDV